MLSPPKRRLRAGLRAVNGNSRGAFATCSSTNAGSSLTRSPSTVWPAWRKSSSAGSHWNSMPMSRTIDCQPSSSTAIDSSDSTS